MAAVDIGSIAESVRRELTIWRASPAAATYNAPMWWQRIFGSLDELANGENDPTKIQYHHMQLKYTLIEFGPLTNDQILAAAPSMAALNEAIRGLS